MSFLGDFEMAFEEKEAKAEAEEKTSKKELMSWFHESSLFSFDRTGADLLRSRHKTTS